jgi:6-phosphogluconolactonase
MSSKSNSSQFLTFFGTNTHGASRGIYRAWFDATQGTFSETELAIEAPNPTFLATCTQRGLLFSTSELPETDGLPQGALFVYAVTKETGELSLINRVLSGGLNPSYVDCDADGRTVITSNIRSGSVASFKIETDGHLSNPVSVIKHDVEGADTDSRLQDKSHPHSISFDPKGRFAIACDRGADRLFVYKHEPETSRLVPNEPSAIITAPGSGPRHSTFHPDEPFVYVLNELNSSVTVYGYEAGKVEELETVSTLPRGFNGENMTAEIEVSANGRCLYCSNRGHNSIAMFRIEENGKHLERLQHCSTRGDWPRAFRIDPTGEWLVAANERTDDAFVFRINPEDGGLTPTGSRLAVNNPTCIRFFSS